MTSYHAKIRAKCVHLTQDLGAKRKAYLEFQVMPSVLDFISKFAKKMSSTFCESVMIFWSRSGSIRKPL